MNKHPKVSVIMPILNEEATIRRCLDSLLAGTFKDFEVVIAYGPSSDYTNEILEEYAGKYKNIHLYSNPSGNTSWGRNIALDNSRGKYIMNYSGHVIAKLDLLKVLVEKLESQPDDVAAVGCSNINPGGQSFIASVSGMVFDSFIGGKSCFVQNAEYDYECYVDHVSFSLYRRCVFDTVGEFDTRFWCGQDAELDLRIIKKGLKILYTPDTFVYHHKRNTLKSLFLQMYRYGIARGKMIFKHKGIFKSQYLLGSVFVLSIVFFLLLMLSGLLPWTLFPIAVMGYALVSFVSVLSKAGDIVHVLFSPLFAFLIHAGYGIGFILGVFYGRILIR